MKRSAPRLEIPPLSDYLEPAVGFVLSLARKFSGGASALEELKEAVASGLSLVIDHNAGGKSEEAVALEVRESEGRLVVDLFNRGLPILLDGSGAGAVAEATFQKFSQASRHCDRISVVNSGRKGQTLSLEFRLASTRGLDQPAATTVIPQGEVLTVREMIRGEEPALSRLFYLVYGYDYINDAVYYPEKLSALREAGDLQSLVAVRPNGRLVGHVGLLRKSSSPSVYEAAMGVVDPVIKSRGLFGRIFQMTMEKAGELPMKYCFFDFVTNHELTQRHVSKYGTCDLAIFVGCQSSQTQARLPRLGLGPDPQGMDRYSLLVSILAREPHPFGRSISLPESIGGPYGFLLKPLGLSWSPAPRFEALPEEGLYATQRQPGQSAVLFDLEEPGQKAAEHLLAQWREFLRGGLRYAAVDVPLDRPGIGPLCDLLSSNGFFAAGFVPYRFSGRLGFRFQALGPTRVAFDEIKVATDPAKKLLKLIRQDYEAACLV